MNYKKIKLMQGVVVVADDCNIVNQTKTESSNYAGIVAEKNGTLPHFLVFSEKPISDYSVKDEENLYELLGKLIPEIEDVRKQEVDAVYRDGIVVNAEEWNAAPRLGMFSVPEVRDIDNLYLHAGIFRKEL